MIADLFSCCWKLIAGSIVLCVVLILVVLRYYIKCTTGVCKTMADMKNKTVIITGANSGIGKETAKDLAKRGARVIMACRTMSTANAVRDEIVATTGNQEVVVRQIDLGSQKSIRDFSAEIIRSERRLDVLIHNAGIANSFSKAVSPDGIEITMATNHFGPFLLTHLLIDLLKKSTPSRIVVVASSLYRLASLNLDNLNPINSIPVYLYYVSKYANISFTLELARRLEGSGVTANCLHPGLIDTGIWRNVPFPMNYPLQLIIKGFFKTSEQGAQTTIHLAVAKELENVNGKYFSDCQESSLSTGVQEPAMGKKLWELSEQMVKLGEDDPRI